MQPFGPSDVVADHRVAQCLPLYAGEPVIIRRKDSAFLFRRGIKKLASNPSAQNSGRRRRYAKPLTAPDQVRGRLYSPDLNPIEPAWSKRKANLRTIGARTREALEAALGPALTTITAQDARGWFRLAGYGAPE
jgi:hypothetical protein